MTPSQGNGSAGLHLPKAETTVLAVIGILSSTLLLKIANIQYVEFLEAFLLLLTLLHFLAANLVIRLSRSMYRLLTGYAVLSCILIVGCGLALTRPFYLDVTGVNRPGYISAARLAELMLGVFTIILLTEVFLGSFRKCVFTAKAYFAAGSVSACLALLGLALHGPFALFVTGARPSGFYNEGGPYGLYLVSVLVLGLALLQSHTVRHSYWMYAALLVDCGALIASASKAGYVAIMLLIVAQVVLAGSHRQRVVSGLATLVGLIVLTSLTNVSRGINGYIEGGRRFEAVSQARPNDVNFSYGRVAAIFFIPRMIAAHPLLGVGFANYGIVRNAPEYRGSAASAMFIDHDGLGLFGLAAEIGLPASALLLYLLFRPAVLVRRLTHKKAVLALAMIQPVVHLCGAQLNLTYPWIASALALGLALQSHRRPAPVVANLGSHAYGATSATLALPSSKMDVAI